MVKTHKYLFPDQPEDYEKNSIRDLIVRHILPGYTPPGPLYDRKCTVVSGGACFAANVADALRDVGVNAHYLKYSESMNSATGTDYVFKEILQPASPYYQLAKSAGLFILTVGVAVAAFHNGEPVYTFTKENSAHLQWRLLGPEEIVHYTGSVIDRMRAVNPDVGVVISISPLPLRMSIGHPSVFGQDCLSKSSIRLGIEMLLQQGRPNVYYWPSYEMVRGLSPHIRPFFGQNGADMRHVDPEIIAIITRLFIDTYFSGTA